MEFKPSKCKVFRISNKCNLIRYNYIMHGKVFKTVDQTEAKHLGVKLYKQLSWNSHANQIRCFLQRNLHNCRQPKVPSYNVTERMSDPSLNMHLLSGIPIKRPTSIKLKWSREKLLVSFLIRAVHQICYLSST